VQEFAPGTNVYFVQANAEELPFATDELFFPHAAPGEALFRRVYPTLHRIDKWLFTFSALLRRMSWYSMVKVCHIGHENVLTTGRGAADAR
jgi:hypothetical protein